MKKIFSHIKQRLFIILFTILCIILGIYNLYKNDEFFKTPFTTIISMLTVVIVSYYFVQKKTDERRKKDKIDKLIYKIQDIINSPDFIISKDENLILQRSVANKITYLKSSINKNLVEDVNKLSKHFNELREFYGEHYTDDEYMKNSYKRLKNFITLMDDICDNIHIKIL